MTPPFILALDQGTSSSRAALMNTSGQLMAVAAEPFPTLYPADGWVEQDPEAVWISQLGAARRLLAETGVTADQLAAIGLTNQRETTLLWRRDSGAPLHNALVWQDRRTAARCEALRESGQEGDLRERTGLVADPYFSATKLEWLLDNVPGARAEAERGELAFGTVDSFLLWRLTGGRVHATDASNASRTLLWNLRRSEWDEHLLATFRVPPSLLAEVHPSAGHFGETDAEWFGQALPVTGIAGDQQAALFGQACFEPGMLKNTYGTGCFLLMNTGAESLPSSTGLLTTAAWDVGGGSRYALEGSVFSAGSAVQWLRDGLGLVAAAADSEPLAASVPDSGGVYVVPAFTGLGAPYWDARARGAVLGLTRGSTAAHLARATLEAIAFQTADLVRCMEQDAGRAVRSLRADGGASENDLLMQFQADLLGVPVERAATRETTALGAAWLAGLGAGLWKGTQELAACWRADRTFEPNLPSDRREQLYAGWRRAVERARDWAR
jgi:glycerol kinase